MRNVPPGKSINRAPTSPVECRVFALEYFALGSVPETALRLGVQQLLELLFLVIAISIAAPGSERVAASRYRLFERLLDRWIVV